MSSVSNLEVDRPREWINGALAMILFVSPWALGFADTVAAAWTAWVTGVVLAVLVVAAVLRFAEWEVWAAMLVGLWLIMSPWVVGFTSTTAAQWTHLVIGILVAAIAAWEVWSVRHQNPTTT